MTRYLLDTNILSELSRPHPSPRLVHWLAARSSSELYLATLTIAEIWRGILQLEVGRRRAALERWFGGPDGPPAQFTGRILAFTEPAAMAWAALMAAGDAAGRPRSGLDMIIAATAQVHDCMVVTANSRHFAGLPFFNPLDQVPG